MFAQQGQSETVPPGEAGRALCPLAACAQCLPQTNLLSWRRRSHSASTSQVNPGNVGPALRKATWNTSPRGPAGQGGDCPSVAHRAVTMALEATYPQTWWATTLPINSFIRSCLDCAIKNSHCWCHTARPPGWTGIYSTDQGMEEGPCSAGLH